MPGTAFPVIDEEEFERIMGSFDTPQEREVRRLNREANARMRREAAEEFEKLRTQIEEEIKRQQAPTIFPDEPAKVKPVKKPVSPMTWICQRCRSSVVFWRNHCDACGAHAAGFEGTTSGVGFPD